MSIRILQALAIAAALGAAPDAVSGAQSVLSPAQKKELSAIRTELNRIRTPIRRDAIDEIQQRITDAEQRLDAVAKEADLSNSDPHLAPLRKMIAMRREAVAKAIERKEKDSRKTGAASPGAKRDSPTKKPVKPKFSFVAEVAPIFVKHCLGCHGSQAKGGLRLDTFAGMRRGGKDGLLLIPGEPESSLIIARLTASDASRMPKDAEPLSEAECLKIAEWIRRGAKFDGGDEKRTLEKLSAADAATTAKTPARKIAVARPTGNETVSFTKDIAPFMVERCLRCHSGNEPKGGLSLETFAGLLAGGKSGPVLEPGDLDKSRLWSLVGKQRPIKMPPGDALIKRAHWNSLRTWILEGAKYDGGDPQRPLRSLVPQGLEQRNPELARMTADELRVKRRKRADELWRRALPKESLQRAENDAFLAYGNVPTERLEEVSRWASDAVQSTQRFFEDHAVPVFKGGLTIFVLKDRPSYEEFSQVVDKREPPAGVRGHAVVTADLEDAYVVLENLPDAATEKGPSGRMNVTEQVTSALLMRSDKKIPDWLVLGSGRALVGSSLAADVPRPSWSQIYQLAGSLEKPDDLFVDGSFSPAAARTVGGALVQYLLKDQGGQQRFVRFFKSLESGMAQADALHEIYKIDQHQMGESFLNYARDSAKQTE